MRTFHIQVLFQVATESYSIYCATKDDRPVILASLNSSSECTFKKKSDIYQGDVKENEV